MVKNFLAAVVVGVVVLGGTTKASAATPEVNRLLAQANGQVKAKDFDRAIKTLDRVIALDPENADAWAAGAFVCNEQENYLAATKLAVKALEADPGHAGAMREGGYALLKLKKYKEASVVLFEAVKKDTKNWPAYDYLAEALDKQGEFTLARDVRTLKRAAQAQDD